MNSDIVLKIFIYESKKVYACTWERRKKVSVLMKIARWWDEMNEFDRNNKECYIGKLRAT